jgi:hypothetical protein
MSKCSPSADTITLTKLPDEVQVHILTYLRAFDLAPMQQTCTFYHNPVLVDKVVTYYIDNVYGTELTVGIIKTAAATTTNTTQSDTDDSKITQKGGKKNHHHPRKMGGKGGSKGKYSLKSPPPLPPPPPPAESNGTITNTSTTDKYTLEHLRSIELTVVARVLSLPEPKTGFYVSKSWIKKTLLWLEKVNDPNELVNTSDGATAQHSSRNNKTKKLSKKQQRQLNRRYVSACVAVFVVHAVV